MATDKLMDLDTSAEVIAYRLLVDILEAEGRPLSPPGKETPRLTRSMLLDAYSECLEVVRGMRVRADKEQ